jgi:hypothetical protein
MSYPCPQCHDRYTRSLPMVYNSGISTWTNQRGRQRQPDRPLQHDLAAKFTRFRRSLIAAVFYDVPVAVLLLMVATPGSGSAEVPNSRATPRCWTGE